MRIIRRSPFTGERNEMEINVTMEQLAAWRDGALIQNAMPNISADEREFIKTGIPPHEFPEEDE